MTSVESNLLDPTETERTLADRAEEERRQREREANDLRHVMGSKQGRRFAYRLLSEAGVYRLSFNAENQASTAFNEGSRNQGLKLLGWVMETCPERYTEMLAEQKEAKERDDNRHADPRNRRPRG